MQDALFGVAGKDFVVLASDTLFRNNIVVSNADYMRCTDVTDKTSVIAAGDQGDALRVVKYAEEVLKLGAASADLRITEEAVAHVLQQSIYQSLRRNPVQVAVIVGGVSEGKGKIFLVDTYGAVSTSRFLASGYPAYLLLSAMDRTFHPEMTADQVVHLIKDIYKGVSERLVLQYRDLHFRVISVHDEMQIDPTSSTSTG